MTAQMTATERFAAMEEAVDDPDELLHLLDWRSFWEESPEPEWLAEPLIPKGRSVAFVAAGKSGKSLLLLDLAVSVATGRPILGQPNPHPPTGVLYLDYEMTQADVRERLEDMGYGPDDDLGRLHYALLPSIDPLDTETGGRYVRDTAVRLGADLVIVDTLARAVTGAEDASDTIRAFYNHTSLLLKQQEITLVRLDHVGHENKDRGRGTSAKRDDVDVVWAITRNDNGLKLKRTHARMPWGPSEVAVRIELGPLRHTTQTVPGWPEGTKPAAGRLDQLEAPLGITKRDATALLKKADGKAARGEVVLAALKYRRQQTARVDDLITDSGTTREPPPNRPSEPRREPSGTANGKTCVDVGKLGREPKREPAGTKTGTNREPSGGYVVPPVGPMAGGDESESCASCNSPRSDLADGLCPPCHRGRNRARQTITLDDP